jgi:hypothetical protein
MIRGELFDRYGPQAHLGSVDEQALDRVNAFYNEIDRMFVPYMRLDQRMPLWWLKPFIAKIKDRRG